MVMVAGGGGAFSWARSGSLVVTCSGDSPAPSAVPEPAKDNLCEIRSNLQPCSVASLILSSQRTFVALHQKSLGERGAEEGGGRQRPRTHFSYRDVLRASREYRSHLSRCVVEIEKEAAAEESARAMIMTTTDGREGMGGGLGVAASMRREPVNHRVEYWRRCLEIWHFCEILFLGDTTILGEKDHSSSSSSRELTIGNWREAEGGEDESIEGGGGGVVSHLLIQWILSHYSQELHSTPLYEKDDRALALARDDSSSSSSSSSSCVTELDAVKELKEVAASQLGGLGSSGSGDERRTRTRRRSKRLARQPENCPHYWPLLLRFVSRGDSSSAAQLLQLHSHFPHEWLAMEKEGRDDIGGENEKREEEKEKRHEYSSR